MPSLTFFEAFYSMFRYVIFSQNDAIPQDNLSTLLIGKQGKSANAKKITNISTDKDKKIINY